MYTNASRSYDGTTDGTIYCYSREGRSMATKALKAAGVSTEKGKDGSWYSYLRAGDGLPGQVRVQLTYEQVLSVRAFWSQAPRLDHLGFEAYGECFEQDLL